MKKIIYIACFFFLVSITSCDEVKLDIINYGSVNGIVLDGETYEPIQGVLITTSPASISLLTDLDGKFSIPKLVEGEVAVNVKKKDYLSNTLSVAVYGEEETKLDVLIFKDENNIGNITVYDPVPGNGALDQLTGFSVKWNVSGKKSSTILTYNIFIFESGSTVQKLVGEGIEDMEVTVTGLKNSTTYYWYVVAIYDGNKVAFSPTWSFKTTDVN
ncbi:MAG TPA: carboxypeptidase regulatory-like domain-containing protein [Prolixibacteraceae bacterium]|nr:carboxypeptidase regulatory-like domain-containing protein [Prolixibacteraceae bacterium]